MKKLTALGTIILSLSSNAYTENLSVKDKEFIEAMIKKEFPSAKYDKEDKKWRMRENKFDYSLTTDFKQIHTPKGTIAALIINKMMKDSYIDTSYLYELKENGNQWVIQTQSKLIDEIDTNINDINIIKLGSQKLGFKLKSLNSSNTGFSKSVDWYYSVNGEYQYLMGCTSRAEDNMRIYVDCTPRIREDLPEADGFYPIELSYNLSKYKLQQVEGDKVQHVKKSEWNRKDFLENLVAFNQGTIVITFDRAKQTYVIPDEYLKALQSKKGNQALWNYFQR